MRPALLLFRGTGVISAAIRWQTRSPYSHAALRDCDGTILESWMKGGTRRTTLKSTDNIDEFRVDGMTPEHWFKTLQWAASHIGHPYDFRGVFRFLNRVSKDDPNSYFCSEYVYDAIAYGFRPLLNNILGYQVSPHHLTLSPFVHYVGPLAQTTVEKP